MKIIDLSYILDPARLWKPAKRHFLHLQNAYTEALKAFADLSIQIYDGTLNDGIYRLSGCILTQPSSGTYTLTSGWVVVIGGGVNLGIFRVVGGTITPSGGNVALIKLYNTPISGEPSMFTNGSTANVATDQYYNFEIGPSGATDTYDAANILNNPMEEVKQFFIQDWSAISYTKFNITATNLSLSGGAWNFCYKKVGKILHIHGYIEGFSNGGGVPNLQLKCDAAGNPIDGSLVLVNVAKPIYINEQSIGYSSGLLYVSNSGLGNILTITMAKDTPDGITSTPANGDWIRFYFQAEVALQ